MVRRGAAVVVASVLAAALVFVVQSTRDDVYASTALLAVDASPSTVSASGGRPENLVFLARTYAARAGATPVLEAATEEAGLDVSAEQARDRSEITVSATDATLTLRTTGPSRADAEALGEGVSAALIAAVVAEQDEQRSALLAPLEDQLRDVEASLGTLAAGTPQREAAVQQYQALVSARAQAQLEPVDTLSVLSPPDAGDDPVAPRPLRSALLTLLVAFVVGSQVLVALALLGRPRARHPVDHGR